MIICKDDRCDKNDEKNGALAQRIALSGGAACRLDVLW
jgi:hypothetical protein